MIPKTHLLVAPSTERDLIGRTIPSSELIRGLIKLNPSLFCPDIKDEKHIEGWGGVTSLWLGQPDGGGRPICGIKLGLIPEWTQIDERGVLITKGWRAIFDRVVKSGAVRQTQIEMAFNVTLGLGEADANLCLGCTREGRREPTNGGVRRMCDIHDGAYTAAARAKSEGPELELRATYKKEKEYVS